MAIRQEHPVARFEALRKHPVCNQILPLSKRQAEKFVANASSFCLGFEHYNGINARRQDED